MEMFAGERKFAIADYVKRKRKASVEELSDHFGVSRTTIRTDLKDLEGHSGVVRTHGGALYQSKAGLQLDMEAKAVQNIEAKRAIASLALSIVEDGDTIIVDTGTTAQEFARGLGEKKSLTVVTNDLIIAIVCEEFDSVQCILIGGAVRSKFHCTVDVGAGEMLDALSVDKAFMATTSFNAERGASVSDMNWARLKRKMHEIANTVILLADTAKFGRSSFAQFASPEEIDIIVTDKEDPFVQRELEGSEIKLIC